MTLEWANEYEFQVWHIAEEAKNSIKLIVSKIVRSKSPVWREHCVLRCSHEFTGGWRDRKTRQNLKIPSKKSGCHCCLVTKFYPLTETILGKYKGHHDHALGNANLQFTRLSDNVKDCVMEMVCTGIDSKAIVSNNTITHFLK